MFKKVSHIGLAVKNLDRAIQFYEDVLGMKIRDRVRVDDMGIEVAFVDIGGDTELELLAPLREGNSIAKFLEKHGPGIHHFCMEVDNIEEQIKTLVEHGVTMIDEKPRIGAEGDKIAFAHPKSTIGALIELKEVQ